MLLTQEQIAAKIKAELNTLVVELGYVDSEGRALYYFHGKVFTYDTYFWDTAVKEYSEDNKLKYLPIIPFALVRDNSVPSVGELIMQRLDTYGFYFHVKSHEREDIQNILEEYMYRQNREENFEKVDNTTILKTFSELTINDEELLGAPDGQSRHQGSIGFSYDLFESVLTTSQDYELTINGEVVRYLSWRFEKANMIIANRANTTAGYSISDLNKLHEIALICELYLDKSSDVITSLNETLFSQTQTNKSYNVAIKKNGVVLFERGCIVQGGKTTDVPPRINTIDITFGLSYARANIKIGTNPNELQDLPVYSYRVGHVAALYTTSYFQDNSAKSTKTGLAKGISLVMPIPLSTPIFTTLINEVLKQDYEVVYYLEIEYYGLIAQYRVVLNDSAVESSDAAYDNLHLVFVEAK